MMSLSKTVLTEQEAAEYIALSRSFLRHARLNDPHSGRTAGPPFVKVGRRVRYLKTDLDRWLESHRLSHDGDQGANDTNARD